MIRIGVLAILVSFLAISMISRADTFGTGANQFSIDFVTISGSTNPTSGIPAGNGFTFTGVVNDYRIGTYEISNDQWIKFTNAYGFPKGNPTIAYGSAIYWPGINRPTNTVSWYEAAQFVNWLNTSTGHQAAYNFIGTQGTADYTFTVWDVIDDGYNPNNPFRNSNAFYFLPTEDEWVKAAYWNGSALQTYATKAGESLYQGNGSNGGWNYWDNGYATSYSAPWNVGTSSEELNGTFDMMGNIWEFMEGSYFIGDYSPGTKRALRGGGYTGILGATNLQSSARNVRDVYSQGSDGGFRVASIPEPCTLLLLGLGGFVIRKR